MRNFLEDEIKKGAFCPMCDGWIQGFSWDSPKRWHPKDGWVLLGRKIGGLGRSHFDRLILTEEMLRYGAPAACHWFAERQIGRAIYIYGTEEQKKEILPKNSQR